MDFLSRSSNQGGSQALFFLSQEKKFIPKNNFYGDLCSVVAKRLVLGFAKISIFWVFTWFLLCKNQGKILGLDFEGVKHIMYLIWRTDTPWKFFDLYLYVIFFNFWGCIRWELLVHWYLCNFWVFFHGICSF